MSKNMTRKGLAFGAGLALIGSGIVVLPAQAAGTITLNPSLGTSFNTLSSSTFKLMPILAGVESAEYKYLRYRVQNVDVKAVTVAIEQGTTGDGELSYAYGSTSVPASGPESATVSYTITDASDADTVQIVLGTGEGAKFAAGDRAYITGVDAGTADLADGVYEITNVSSDTITVVGGALVSGDQSSAADTNGRVTNLSRVSDDDFVVYPDDLDSSPGSNAAVLGGQNYLKITPITDEAVNLTVTAWLDTNQNNTIDSGEVTSTAKAVGFLDVSKLSASVSITKPLVGDTSLKTYVSFTGDVNYRQIDSGDVQITFGGPTSSYATIGSAANVAWDTTEGAYMVTFSNADLSGSGDASIDASDMFKATLRVDNNRDGDKTDDGDVKATATTSAVASLTNPTMIMQAVSAAGVVTTTKAEKDDATTDDTNIAASQNGVASVKTGTASFSVSIFVGTDATTSIGVASRPVKVTVAGTNVTNSDTVIVDGKAVEDGAATTTVTTGSNGVATFSVTLGSADAGDVLRFTPSIDGTSYPYLDVTVTDGDFTLSQLVTGSPSIKVGDTFSIEYRAVDQFGVAPKNNTHSVLVAPIANERTKAAEWSYSIPVVDGKAVLIVTDNGTGTGKFTANAKLVVNGTTTAVTNGTVDIVVNVVADPAVATLTLEKLTYGTAQANDANNDGDFADTGDTDNTGALLVESRAFADYDSRYALPTVSAPTVRDTYKVVVGAAATNAAKAAVVGAPVTFSAAGMLFKSGTRLVKDSITVHAGSTGIASVEVWSSVGGAREVKITSGTATVTQKLTFAAGTGSAGSFTVSAPVTASAGTTADVTVKVLDSLGNPAKGVTVTLFSKGPGYLINTTGTTLTDGTFSTKLLIGSNDSGTAVVSAVVTIAGVETIKTSEIKIGAAAGKVNVASFNGKLVVYAAGLSGSTISWKVGGRWGKAVAASNYAVFNRPTPVSGVTVSVDVYVNGVKTLTKSVVTR